LEKSHLKLSAVATAIRYRHAEPRDTIGVSEEVMAFVDEDRDMHSSRELRCGRSLSCEAKKSKMS